jgi:hypothetical protein
MKHVSILLLSLQLVNTSLVQAVKAEAPARVSKPTLMVLNFENKNGPMVDSQWNFLRRQQGPSPDPISNGVMRRLEQALMDTGQFAVSTNEVDLAQRPVYRGLSPEEQSTVEPPPTKTLPFIVRGDVSFSDDHITIVVRLVDTQTNKVIKATTVEGRPEDITRLAALSGSPEERAVQAAIEKAVASIQGALLQWVVVKVLTMKVRQEPSLQSAPLATVRQGERLQKVEEEGEWVRVQLRDGETGWVPFKLVETAY